MAEPGDPLRGLLAAVLALALVALTGFFLVIGKGLLLPIFVAVISVYVLTGATNFLGRMPGIRATPEWQRRVFVLVIFLLIVASLGAVMIATAAQVSERLPQYQQNFGALAERLAHDLGLQPPDWAALSRRLSGTVSLPQLATMTLSSISAAAGMVSLVVVYAAFLSAERHGFAHKLAVALPGARRRQAEAIIADINTAISDYLAVKTLVNAILGVMSFAVMWAIGVDFALFWAIAIALLNYIPYVGSMLGVMFPVLLSVAQFGSVTQTLLLTALLTAAQLWVGNVLEPRMIGRKVNMSPFVVMVALALWSSVWGLAGAILAIPLTSIAAIVMGSFDSTRPFAILLAGDVSVFEDRDDPVS